MAVTSKPRARVSTRFSLDAINFLLADVRGALGPYLNVFLVTQQHWSQSEVGLVTTISGLLGLAVQTPIGAAIDETRAKRGAIVLALAVLAVGSRRHLCVADFLAGADRQQPDGSCRRRLRSCGRGPDLGPVRAASNWRDAWGGTRPSTMPAMSRIAVVAGAVGYAFSQRAVFLLVPVFAMLASIAVLSIPAKAIDYNRARDLDGEPDAAATAPRARRLRHPVQVAAAGRSSACASCCSISPMRRCCRWWDRSSPPHTPRKRRP